MEQHLPAAKPEVADDLNNPVMGTGFGPAIMSIIDAMNNLAVARKQMVSASHMAEYTLPYQELEKIREKLNKVAQSMSNIRVVQR